eukprot:1183202-Rhodomonas_salina.1
MAAPPSVGSDPGIASRGGGEHSLPCSGRGAGCERRQPAASVRRSACWPGRASVLEEAEQQRGSDALEPETDDVGFAVPGRAHGGLGDVHVAEESCEQPEQPEARGFEEREHLEHERAAQRQRAQRTYGLAQMERRHDPLLLGGVARAVDAPVGGDQHHAAQRARRRPGSNAPAHVRESERRHSTHRESTRRSGCCRRS